MFKYFMWQTFLAKDWYACYYPNQTLPVILFWDGWHWRNRLGTRQEDPNLIVKRIPSSFISYVEDRAK